MERDHLKGASGDAINIILAAALSAEGIDLSIIDNHHDPGRIAYSLDTRPRAVPGGC